MREGFELHWETLPASPAPNRKRMTTNEAAFQAETAAKIVNAYHPQHDPYIPCDAGQCVPLGLAIRWEPEENSSN